VQKSLLDYITSEDEHAIVKSIEGSKQISKEEDNKNLLIDLVVKWRMYIGIPKADVAEELVLVAAFIFENYGFLTIPEIELAIKLSVRRKLKDTEFHGYFSPMYVGKVLDSYLYYRKMTMADAIRRREKAIAEQVEKSNKPSPEQQAEDYKELFVSFYNEYKSQGYIRDVFNLCYNFLRKHDMMKVSKERIEEAQAYGRKRVEEVKETARKEGRKIDYDLGLEEKRWARNYCVQKYFDSVDINIICGNIKPEHFQ
jgi:hypothetical protein